MLKILTILTSFLAFNSFSYAQSLNPDRSHWTNEQFWMEVNLSFQTMISGPLNNKLCFKDYAQFSGCLNGLSEGVTTAKNDGKFYAIKPNPNAKQGFDFVGLQPTNVEDAKKLDLYNKELKHWYKQLTSNLVMKRVDFETSYADFKVQFVNKTNESYLTAAIYNGFLERAFDPHTYYIPTHLNNERAKGKISYGGQKGIFGISYRALSHRGNESMLILNVVDESSSKLAGLEEGDIILSINKKTDYKSMVEEMSNNSSVSVKVEGSAGVRDLTISRSQFTVNGIKSELLSSLEQRKVGYIKFSTFMDKQGCKKIVAEGVKLKNSGAEAIIIDLRGNGGGYVGVATCINSHFLEKKSLVFVEKNLQTNRVTNTLNILPNGEFRNIHTAVLIDSRSASASEIVSIYLQAYRKAFIVGENSFGKGTMQMVKSTIIPKLSFASTVARYYGPQGVSPQLQGVLPDIVAYKDYNQTEPSKATRERDLYDNAISNDYNEAPMMPERENQLSAVKNCLENDDAATRSYDERDEYKKRVHDNQKYMAIATLDCALKLRIPVFKGLNIPKI